MYSKAWSQEELEALIDKRIQRALHKLFRPEKKRKGAMIRYWLQGVKPEERDEIRVTSFEAEKESWIVILSAPVNVPLNVDDYAFVIQNMRVGEIRRFSNGVVLEKRYHKYIDRSHKDDLAGRY